MGSEVRQACARMGFQSGPGIQLGDPKTFRSGAVNLAFASLTINLLSLALPVMTLQIYDRVLTHNGVGTLRVLAIGVGAVIVLEVVLRLARAYMTTWSSAVFEHDATCRAFKHLTDAQPASLGDVGPGEHLQRLAAVGRLRDFVGGQALVSLIDLPFVLIFLGLVAYLAGPLVFVPLVLLGTFALLAWALGHRLKATLVERDRVGDERIGFIIETLSGIHTVKSLGIEASFCRRHERLQSALTERNYHVAMASSGAAVLAALFSQIMMISVTLVGAPMVIMQNLTVGTLVACVLLSGRIMQPLQRALGVWTRLQDVQLAQKQYRAIFALPTIDKLDPSQEVAKQGRLELSGVSFRFDDEAPFLFEDVDLSLERGQSISIGGPHGSGKTILLQVMAGLLAPTAGRVLVDDVEPVRCASEVLADHIGYVATDGVVFQGTIRENLTGFDIKGDDSAMEIADLLGIDDAVSKLPAGYDTQLNAGAAEAIPPGLRQLIAIGRVLAHKPRILLFDSADKGLDKEGYNQVFRLLGRLKGKVTMVIVSDDRNFLRLAQDEYVLADGYLLAHDYSGDSKIHDVMPYRELRL